MEVWAGGLKVIIGMILRFEDKRSAVLNRSGCSSEIRMEKNKTFLTIKLTQSLQHKYRSKRRKAGRDLCLTGDRTVPNLDTRRYFLKKKIKTIRVYIRKYVNVFFCG